MLDSPAVRKELLQQRDHQPLAATFMQTSFEQNAYIVPTAQSTTLQLPLEQLELLGAALFFDTSLSRHQNQSCASCHDPARAFSDPRPAAVLAGVSLGSDGVSLGQRNAPALTYVGYTPALSLNDSHAIMSGSTINPVAASTPADAIRGGFFWDGREATLESQVLTPFVNEKEMALPSLHELAQRIIDNPQYHALIGETVDHAQVLSQVSGALAAYLRSDALNSFDSRYDRYLRGELKPTRQEMIGMGLFFSPGFTSCATCHQSAAVAYSSAEVFSNHRYENIGTPINKALLAQNGMGNEFRDPGLAGNTMVKDTFESVELAGRIKVPSLRNVAVTGPYMHNGVFNDLSTLMVFYNHFNETGNSGLINPETGQPWVPSAFPEGVAAETSPYVVRSPVKTSVEVSILSFSLYV
jgi:cytochrome c peroxidase